MSKIQSSPRGRVAAASIAAIAAAFLMATPLASAQSQSDIVVTAATREQAQAFISQISTAPPAASQMGRWARDVCIGVAGLPARQGQFLADRVAQRAFALGLEPGEPGCAPNISIVVTRDGNAMAQQMFEQDQSLFAYRSETGVSTLGQDAFQGFLNSERPVRWWHVTRAVNWDGESLSNTSGSSGGMESVRSVRSNGSLVRSNTRQDFSRVVIIIDADQAGSRPLSALSDYVAMVALAQIAPDVNASAYSSILNLFSASGNAPTELTAWDTAYLNGLYTSGRSAMSVNAQRGDIARRMLGDPQS